MVAPPKQDLWLFKGQVTAVNEKGLKLDAMGDDWINFTKEEWRGSWYAPQRGEAVTIQCTQDKNGRYWVKTIVLDGHQDWSEPELPPTGAPATNRDLSIIRQVCIKAAAEIVAARMATVPADYSYGGGPEAWTVVAGVDVLAIAQDLERWAVRAE